MTLIRANVVFKHLNGLPRDQYVNTFHFSTEESYADAGPIIRTALFQLYNVPVSPATNSIFAYLSRRIALGASIKTYDLETFEPRIPTTSNFTMTGGAWAGGTPNLPSECAVCVSFHGAAPVNARKRGRVFLGPLSTVAAGEGAGGECTPAAGFVSAAKEAFEAFLQGPAGDWWNIRSTAGAGMWTPVVGGWIDDAFDTQRRRGNRPTTRTLITP